MNRFHTFLPHPVYFWWYVFSNPVFAYSLDVNYGIEIRNVIYNLILS